MFSKKIKIEEKIEEKNSSSLPLIPKETGWLKPEGQLAVDVYETDSDFVLLSAIAGVFAEDLDISVEKDMLIIKGYREKPKETEEKNYFYQECYWGLFSRKVILPVGVDASRTEASMDKGILTIRIPKIQPEKKRKITVQPHT